MSSNKNWSEQRIIEVVKSYNSKLFYKVDRLGNHYWLVLTDDKLSIEYGRKNPSSGRDGLKPITRWTKKFPNDFEKINEIFMQLKETLTINEDDDALDILLKGDDRIIKPSIVENNNMNENIFSEANIHKALKLLNEEIDWVGGLTSDEAIKLKRIIIDIMSETDSSNLKVKFNNLVNIIRKIPHLFKIIENII